MKIDEVQRTIAGKLPNPLPPNFDDGLDFKSPIIDVFVSAQGPLEVMGMKKFTMKSVGSCLLGSAILFVNTGTVEKGKEIQSLMKIFWFLVLSALKFGGKSDFLVKKF